MGGFLSSITNPSEDFALKIKSFIWFSRGIRKTAFLLCMDFYYIEDIKSALV